MQIDYSIIQQNYQRDIDQQYTGDISQTSTTISAIEKVKDELKKKLAQRELNMNEKKKTEKYNFKKVNCYHRSRDSKLFGSLLDAPNNIQRRKVLAIVKQIN